MKKLVSLGLGLGLCACAPTAAEHFGGAMADAGVVLADAGAALMDAGGGLADSGEAQAQPPIEVQCEPSDSGYLAFMPNTEGATASDLFGVEAVVCGRTDVSPGFGECLSWAAGLHEGRIAVYCGVEGSRWQRVLFERR